MKKPIDHLKTSPAPTKTNTEFNGPSLTSKGLPAVRPDDGVARTIDEAKKAHPFLIDELGKIHREVVARQRGQKEGDNSADDGVTLLTCLGESNKRMRQRAAVASRVKKLKVRNSPRSVDDIIRDYLDDDRPVQIEPSTDRRKRDSTLVMPVADDDTHNSSITALQELNDQLEKKAGKVEISEMNRNKKNGHNQKKRKIFKNTPYNPKINS